MLRNLSPVTRWRSVHPPFAFQTVDTRQKCVNVLLLECSLRCISIRYFTFYEMEKGNSVILIEGLDSPSFLCYRM
jgi:hypothetical protein